VRFGVATLRVLGFGALAGRELAERLGEHEVVVRVVGHEVESHESLIGRSRCRHTADRNKDRDGM
jgi:hypothetical protein